MSHGGANQSDPGNGAEQIRLGREDLFLGEDDGDPLLKRTDPGLKHGPEIGVDGLQDCDDALSCSRIGLGHETLAHVDDLGPA